MPSYFGSRNVVNGTDASIHLDIQHPLQVVRKGNQQMNKLHSVFWIGAISPTNWVTSWAVRRLRSIFSFRLDSHTSKFPRAKELKFRYLNTSNRKRSNSEEMIAANMILLDGDHMEQGRISSCKVSLKRHYVGLRPQPP